MTLLDRLRAAPASEERYLIREALTFAHANELITDGPYDAAVAMWRVGAHLSAALSLVPTDWEWELRWECGKAYSELGDPKLLYNEEASTPALAVVTGYLNAKDMIAALEARGDETADALNYQAAKRQARAEALEEAARVCEDLDSRYSPDTSLLGRAAEAIRALKPTE